MNPREIRLTEILRKYGLRTAYLFGSQQEAGSDFLQGREAKFDEKSDLDVGVVVIRPHQSLDYLTPFRDLTRNGNSLYYFR